MNFYDRLRAHDKFRSYPVSNRYARELNPYYNEKYVDINGHEVIHDLTVDCYWFVVPGSGSHYIPITNEKAAEIITEEGYTMSTNISYLVTCHNETDTLHNLLLRLSAFLIGPMGEIVILRDPCESKETKNIINEYLDKYPGCITYKEHALANDYGAHKNYGNALCRGDYIFQIDGDECPTEDLLGNLEGIINANPTTELFWVPRINNFKGVTQEHAARWGWRLSTSPTYGTLLVNWPDYQARIYRNLPHIRWNRRLHETIEGHQSYAVLPADETLALYHDKTIERQIATNERYNKMFTDAENKGHHLWADSNAKQEDVK